MSEMQEHALGTLAEWLPGYTSPESGPQHRVRLVKATDRALIVTAEDTDSREMKVYLVTVSTEEIV